ncbi:MAG: hypothetical protein LBH72_01595 [Proteiniphilum sp.]|nr:hypothetical protein [Proteiniphilum sp.]
MKRRSLKHSLLPIATALLMTAVSCVEEEEKAPDLSVTPESLNLENIAGRDTITVTCCTAWMAESNVEWLTLSPESGTGKGEIIVTAINNAAREAREAEVTVTVTEGSIEKTVTVTQAAATELKKSVEFTFTGDAIAFSATAESITVDWGDGQTERYRNLDSIEVRHTCASKARRTVRIEAENLSVFVCTSQQLTALDVSNCTTLTKLNCCNNLLSALDLSKNRALTALWCEGNQLSTLDLFNNRALAALWCEGNQLSTLDLFNNTALTWLSCSGNQLSALDLSRNRALTRLACVKNQLSADALNGIFTDLPDLSDTEAGRISLLVNPGSDTCDRSIAEAKNWKFHEFVEGDDE